LKPVKKRIEKKTDFLGGVNRLRKKASGYPWFSKNIPQGLNRLRKKALE